jgi:hypothetical protein
LKLWGWWGAGPDGLFDACVDHAFVNPCPAGAGWRVGVREIDVDFGWGGGLVADAEPDTAQRPGTDQRG